MVQLTQCYHFVERQNLSSVYHLNNFHFNSFVNELHQRAPTLLAVLTAAARPERPKKRELDSHVIVMAAAVLLKQRNKHLRMYAADHCWLLSSPFWTCFKEDKFVY